MPANGLRNACLFQKPLLGKLVYVQRAVARSCFANVNSFRVRDPSRIRDPSRTAYHFQHILGLFVWSGLQKS